MQRMVPWHGPAVSGLSIGVILFLSAGFQYLARPRPTKGSAIVGFACLVACNLLLLVNSFAGSARSEEHTSELQSPCNLVCRLLLEKKKRNTSQANYTSTSDTSHAATATSRM